MGAFSILMPYQLHSRFGLFADYEGNEGYVQGMSDLCAPVYIVMGSDEELTFWCFVEVMNRMVSASDASAGGSEFRRNAETKFPSRSKRHEETVADTTTVDQCHGSGALSSLRFVYNLLFSPASSS